MRKQSRKTERLVTPPRRGTSPTWGPPPPCEQALRSFVSLFRNVVLSKLFLFSNESHLNSGVKLLLKLFWITVNEHIHLCEINNDIHIYQFIYELLYFCILHVVLYEIKPSPLLQRQNLRNGLIHTLCYNNLYPVSVKNNTLFYSISKESFNKGGVNQNTLQQIKMPFLSTPLQVKEMQLFLFRVTVCRLHGLINYSYIVYCTLTLSRPYMISAT